MSLLRPLPPGVTHALNDDGLQFLPPFVRARLQYLADRLEWLPDEEDEETCFTYYEVRGKLSDGYYTLTPEEYVSPINIWIAGDDNCYRSLYIGGSAWICPDNHYLFFDAIPPDLVPGNPDSKVWWCIQYGDDIKVIQILVCPPEEIAENFPDGV